MAQIDLPPKIAEFASHYDKPIRPFEVARAYCEARWLIASGEAEFVGEQPSSMGLLLVYRTVEGEQHVYAPQWDEPVEQRLEELIQSSLKSR